MGRHRAADGNRTKYPGDVKESSSKEDDADEETDEDNDNPEGRIEGKEKDGDEKEASDGK